MKLLCKYCIEKGMERGKAYIGEDQYWAHVEEWHIERIEDKVFAAIDSSKDRVKAILEHYPDTRSHEGLLVTKVLQRWPFRDAQCLYLPAGSELLTITLYPGDMLLKAPYMQFASAMKHIGTLTRMSRLVRGSAEFRGSLQKEIERSLEERESRRVYARGEA